jgi:tRNA pseudouridine55 synthase
MEGEVIETKTVAHLDCEQIAKVVNGFSGIHRLPVPRYSAVKVDGVPLYKRARAGEVFEPPVREMKVLSMSLAACERVGDFFELTVEMNVASGVYVRSVVEVLGEVLGTVATTTSLRRTSIGEHNVASLNVFTI